ncbi:MAG: nucleotidyltransferase family protein [Ruminococcus sp.]|nr:nucleotidyltransferase family protein [Ruminococcus sp.]
MNAYFNDLIYLLSCAVNGDTPDAERTAAMDTEKLYGLAKYHSVRSAVCIALERAGIVDAKFHDAMKKAVRKNIYLDTERQAISEEFERHGIWYMPLKGAVLKDIYPENGMREMADCDILYDSTKQEELREIMLSKGYTAESVGKIHHDIYHKPPVLNFEMHTVLFGDSHAEDLRRYYSDPMRMMIKDSDNDFGYHLNDEDFYIYMTAHEYKHYSLSGTGIRSLLDCYVYVKEKGDALDWSYIRKQTDELGITGYEQQRRELAVKVFSSPELPVLNDAEKELLTGFLTAGTYGTFENSVKKKLEGQSKAGYILRSMFPDVEYMKVSVDFVNRHPVLYPVGIVYRWGRIIKKRRNYIASIMKVMKENKNAK